MTNTKMTYVDALNTVLTAGEGIYSDAVIEKLTSLRDSIVKRNTRKATGERKPTKTQKANAELAENVADFLHNKGVSMTCKEIAEEFEVSTQKMSAILRQIPNITKMVVKGVSWFSIQ